MPVNERIRSRACFFALAAWLLVDAAQAAPPVAKWEFSSEETSKLTPHGGVHRDVPGPRPPEFPDFEPGNTAVKLDGSGAHFSFADSGPKSPFDFTTGDAITIEAWVKCDDLRAGENRYIIGKGRTRSAGFAADNQNWALRLREVKGKACASFLFATPIAAGAKTDAHWHRWTTREGFLPNSGWHHLAVAYRFGEPETVRGWIDGVPLPGDWDMGGATREPPVVDDDEIWIGSSNGGQASNSFRGYLDAIAVHRELLTDEVMKTRYVRTGAVGATKKALPAPETMPKLASTPGKVLATFSEGLPAHERWLNEGEEWPAETARFEADAFLLNRLPLRYESWGIRDSWKPAVLVRMGAEVQLPAAKQRFLLRARGLSRLWVNGVVIARTKPLSGSPSGEEPMTPVAKPPAPGLRIAEHRQQEVFGEATIPADGKCVVVLETIVGGKAFRADPGELCVAVQASEGSFRLLTAAGASHPEIQLTDADVTAALARQEVALAQQDDQARRAAASSQDAFWKKRHAAGREWVKQHPAPTPPAGKHTVDAFLAVKVERALAESAKTPEAEAKKFHSSVFAILRDECFRCHGDKEKGGLRLNSREAALKMGDSEVPAIVPGDVAGSELIRRIRVADADERMPPNGAGLKPEQIAVLEAWVKSGAAWPAPPVIAAEVAAPPVIGDAAFLRRVSLDTIGLPPTEAEVRDFIADKSADKRTRLIDVRLADPRGADHAMGYWQDVLAENPTLLNPSLNTTGPFRWFLHEGLRDDKPLDRLVTELILMRGSPHDGGSAGFGIAADNDAPLAAKGQIVASAFLGIELQCARCHDSPYHSTKQRDLYALAAMMERKSVTVPKTSRVPDAFFEKKARESLIHVTLKPGEPIASLWPFAEVTGSSDDAKLDALLQKPDDSRERLAALVTAPQNERFAQVIVNRVWRRLMGAGFVEPAHDWEGHPASHPELLNWLAREFVAHDYSMRHLTRLILTSQSYQREATGKNLAAGPELRFFVAPDRRRLNAEQVVDSLFQAAGQRIEVEELTFDPDGRRAASNRLSLGVPQRAWMFASLANERDRPSLSLPRAQAVADILEAFGWSGSRQNPRTDREIAPNVLQPGVLANGVAAVGLTRVADRSGLADVALAAPSPASLVDGIFLRYLGRLPTTAERGPLADVLAVGFAERVVPAAEVRLPVPPEPLPRVTWSNHLRPESTSVAMELEKRSRMGPSADPRLRNEWREALEDVVWSLVNLREFVWIP